MKQKAFLFVLSAFPTFQRFHLSLYEFQYIHAMQNQKPPKPSSWKKSKLVKILSMIRYIRGLYFRLINYRCLFIEKYFRHSTGWSNNVWKRFSGVHIVTCHGIRNTVGRKIYGISFTNFTALALTQYTFGYFEIIHYRKEVSNHWF